MLRPQSTLPAASKALPSISAAFLAAFETLPAASYALPGTTEAPPATSKSFPAASLSAPRRPVLVPSIPSKSIPSSIPPTMFFCPISEPRGQVLGGALHLPAARLNLADAGRPRRLAGRGPGELRTQPRDALLGRFASKGGM